MTALVLPIVGIIGCGQLGRMLGMAALQLGCRVHVFGPDAVGTAPAHAIAEEIVCAQYDDIAAVREFARACTVVTYEFENVPLACADAAAAVAPLFPSARALEIAQDRLHEKTFAQQLGIAVPDFETIDSEAALAAALARINAPCVLKTRRLGYDGKGQVRIAPAQNRSEAHALIAQQPCLIEKMIAFECEISLITVRDKNGNMRHWGPVRNEHEHGILRWSHVPAQVSQQVAARALAASEKIAEALDYIGVLAVEYFVNDGDVMFNEMAPRVHNSGHWTIEGACISQFENHIRAILGWPLGDTAARGTVKMKNLLGSDAANVPALLRDDTAHVHLYGKTDAAQGRKMGHVTWVQS